MATTLRVSTREERDKYLKDILKCSDSTNIDLSHSLFLTNDLLEKLVQQCPKIDTLKLWNCLSLTDAGLTHLSKLKALKWVCVGDNPNFTSEGVGSIVRGCPDLEYIDFSCCPLVDYKLALDIAQSEKLVTICAEFCDSFTTEKAMSKLKEGKCSQITTLVFGNGSMTDRAIDYIAECPFKESLKSIDLRRNAGVTKIGYDKLVTLPLEEIDGILLSTVKESNPGEFFMSKKTMIGDG